LVWRWYPRGPIMSELSVSSGGPRRFQSRFLAG